MNEMQLFETLYSRAMYRRDSWDRHYWSGLPDKDIDFVFVISESLRHYYNELFSRCHDKDTDEWIGFDKDSIDALVNRLDAISKMILDYTWGKTTRKKHIKFAISFVPRLTDDNNTLKMLGEFVEIGGFLM